MAQRSDQETIIQDHQNRIADLSETVNVLTQHLDQAESSKNLEVSRCENEIRKVEEDIEQISSKLNSLKKQDELSTPESVAYQQYHELVDFQQETENTGQQMVQLIQGNSKAEDPKLQIYDLQRQINDYEYQINSDEVALKRKQEEELRVRKK